MRKEYIAFIGDQYIRLWSDKAGLLGECLKLPLPESSLQIKGLGDRLCAFLTVKTFLTDGKRAASNVAATDPQSSQLPSIKAATAKGWVTDLIDVGLEELFVQQDMEADAVKEIMGGRRYDFGRGIVPKLQGQVACG